MPNTYRGETPFRALGRDLFLVYRTREIAAMQAALGFCRPDPVAKPTVEEVPALNLKRDDRGEIVHEMDADGARLAALDETDKPRMRQIVLDARERQRRRIEAFDACLASPVAADLIVMVRCGLEPWEREHGRLTERDWDRLLEELGYFGLAELHQRALQNAYSIMLPATGTEDDDPNAKSPVRASLI